MQFIKSVQNFAFQNKLWQKGSRILVGVSGGPDSACLLDVLAKLAPKYNFEIQIAHVNYALRGKDSDLDAKLVKTLAKKYGCKVHIFKPKKAQYKGNLENCLRDIRYDFFEKIARQQGLDVIAVAHNQDDQAETVLMRIIRGSGLGGLSAMKAKNGCIIRPLLKTSKSEILKYLAENKLAYRIDESNNREIYTRNKIRLSLLPYLEKNFNPKIKQTLASLAEGVADDYEFIQAGLKDFKKVFLIKNKKAKFSANDFQKLHASIQRQYLQMAARILLDEKSLEMAKIEELRKVINGEKRKRAQASVGGLKIAKKGDSIEIFC